MEDPLLTRETLILRLRDAADDASWAEFAEIYTPLLFGYCRKRSIPTTDAEDIIQGVMASVAKAMGGFDYNRQKGTFKGWLFTILRNAIANHFRKASRRPVTTAETQVFINLEADPGEGERLDWERDYQKHLLAWAMEKVKEEFSERIWGIFEASAIHGRDHAELATELGISKNAIAVARHRVTKRLREKTESVDAEHWEQEIIQRSELMTTGTQKDQKS